MPEELENLTDIARIKYLSKKLNIEKIASRKNVVVFTFNPSVNREEAKIELSTIIQKYGNRIKFSSGIKPMITLEIGSKKEGQILKEVIKFLKRLK